MSGKRDIREKSIVYGALPAFSAILGLLVMIQYLTEKHK